MKLLSYIGLVILCLTVFPLSVRAEESEESIAKYEPWEISTKCLSGGETLDCTVKFMSLSEYKSSHVFQWSILISGQDSPIVIIGFENRDSNNSEDIFDRAHFRTYIDIGNQNRMRFAVGYIGEDFGEEGPVFIPPELLRTKETNYTTWNCWYGATDRVCYSN